MAGMLIAAFDRRWNDRWGFILAVFAGWFAFRAIGGFTQPNLRTRMIGHHLQHLLACGAMVYMLVGISAPIAQASVSARGIDDEMAGMAAMAGTGVSSPGATQSPTVALVLAVVLLCYAGWSVAELVVAGPGQTTAATGTSMLAPRFAICCQIAMSVTMSSAARDLRTCQEITPAG